MSWFIASLVAAPDPTDPMCWMLPPRAWMTGQAALDSGASSHPTMMRSVPLDACVETRRAVTVTARSLGGGIACRNGHPHLWLRPQDGRFDVVGASPLHLSTDGPAALRPYGAHLEDRLTLERGLGIGVVDDRGLDRLRVCGTKHEVGMLPNEMPTPDVKTRITGFRSLDTMSHRHPTTLEARRRPSIEHPQRRPPRSNRNPQADVLFRGSGSRPQY